jgi:hypothetical protein
MRKYLPDFIFGLLVIILILQISCIRKTEPKKDDFLGTTQTEEPKKEKDKTRIHVIDGGAWTQYQIVEVDGHEYLCNAAHGGMVHLESCPCKKKL